MAFQMTKSVGQAPPYKDLRRQQMEIGYCYATRIGCAPRRAAPYHAPRNRLTKRAAQPQPITPFEGSLDARRECAYT